MGKFSPTPRAIPQFGLQSYISSLRLSSGHSGPVLTLSNAAHASLFSPQLAGGGCESLWATSPMGAAVRRVICGFYLFVYSSRLCCPPRFQNSPQTRWREGFLVFGNFAFTTPSPGQVSFPNSFVSLFIFYILSYLPSKTMGCFSGAWCPLPAFRSCFVEFAQRSNKWSFDEFVGEKVVSPSYSSAILGPPPSFISILFSFFLYCISFIFYQSIYVLFIHSFTHPFILHSAT